MASWLRDGLIAWGAVFVFGTIVSLVSKEPYTLQATIIYMLVVGLLAVPGGVLAGRYLGGVLWTAVGGLISAAVLYYGLNAILGPF